jgi:hypothetical protein
VVTHGVRGYYLPVFVGDRERVIVRIGVYFPYENGKNEGWKAEIGSQL